MASSPTPRLLQARSIRRRGPGTPTPTLFPSIAQSTTGPAAGASTPTPSDRSRSAGSQLIGIARLAHSAPCAESKRGTEYFLLPVKSILNRCDSERVPFAWTVNPYRGCEFGCRYCYARYTHEYMELDGGEFESKIYVKQNAGRLAARDLEREAVWGEHIAIGTATDPYQPAEREFGATRSVLEQMAQREGLSLSITTKSNQVVRDVGLLQQIAARNDLSVNLSVTTLRARLARLLEPRAPRPDLRLAAVRALREAGLAAGIFAMPILPGITDGEEDLDRLACAARDAGAQWFAAGALFLMPSSSRQFLPWLAKAFPKLARRYQEWYARSGYAPDAYRRELAARITRLREKYSLGQRPVGNADRAWHSPQLALALRDT